MGLDRYVLSGGKRLRRGYTTGSCAAAAAKAAAIALLTGGTPARVEIETPEGVRLDLPVESCERGMDFVRCGVRKDGGDDIDATDGALVCAEVRLGGEEITVDGGEGVGRVTRPGLEQPVGAAAINIVPRLMVAHEVRDAFEEHGRRAGATVVISVPGGAEIAARTYNPRLGIVGGISILGTTGIVEPMSGAALVDTIQAELKVLRAAGTGPVVVTPGSYGETFSRETLGLLARRAVLCSNYIGETIDCAAALGFEGMLLVGHLGKFVKLAGGIFNTHSRVADARMEILAAHAGLAGADAALVKTLLDCATTDEAADLLEAAGLLAPVMRSVTNRATEQVKRRAGTLSAEVIIYSNARGVLGQSEGTGKMLRQLKETEETG